MRSECSQQKRKKKNRFIIFFTFLFASSFDSIKVYRKKKFYDGQHRDDKGIVSI